MEENTNLPEQELAKNPARNPKGTNQHTAGPKDVKAFRKSLQQGLTLQKAMLSAGYSENAARQGVRKLSSTFLKALRAEKQSQIALAREFTPSDTADYVVGGLIANTMNGEDRAVRSYELLGKTKAVGLFQAESTAGVFIIEMPAHLAKQIRPQVIDGPDDSTP